MKKIQQQLFTQVTRAMFFLLLFYPRVSQAQCGAVISTFPYNEGFETTSSWTAGGTNSDWAWGTPAHPTISTAGGGSKSWCVGGLTGTSYNGSQESWLMSPCFDFSSLNYPWISFKIFWENEWKWDGTVFQYSLDGGITWSNVGAYNDPVDCMNDNWYNYNNISWLTSASPKHGWSGRVGSTSGSCQGGNGSGSWLTAKHCLNGLAGQSSVRFRFLFGSGTTCNGFDGISIDDILIQDALANTAAFMYTCTGTTVSFTNASGSCPSGFSWIFGDPSSGTSNTSTIENPTHTFAAPGTYMVTLTAIGPCNAPGVITLPVTVMSASTSVTNVSCNGAADGSATVTPTGTGPFTYTWNTTPAQTTATASGLAPGTYTVNVNDAAGSCPATATVTIVQPTAITVTTTSSPACSDVCNGIVDATVTGGQAPYAFTWSGLGTAQTYSSVCSGTYALNITDANGCTASSSADVALFPSPIVTCQSQTICMGSTATLQASGAASYTWSPPDGLNTTTGAVVEASPGTTTAYVVTGVSAEGCSASIDVLVNVNASAAPQASFIFTPQNADVFNPLVDFTNTTTGSVTGFTWNFGGLGESTQTSPSFGFPVDSAGLYEVCLMASNGEGCADTVCRIVTIEGFQSIYVPNSFTPNGDGYNDEFFPVIRDVAREGFEIRIFDRWGEIIFVSSNLQARWDGTRNGVLCKGGVYVWHIVYVEPTTGVSKEIQGHLNLLR